MKKGLFQLQYELDSRYTEAGSDQGAKLDVHDIDDADVRQFLSDTVRMGYKETVKYLKRRQEQLSSDSGIAIIPFTTSTPEALAYRLENISPRLTFLSRPLNTVERLDEMLYAANWRLPQGAYLCAHSMTAALKKSLTLARYPWGIGYVMVAWDFLWHRVCPKLKLTKGLYFAITGGKKRTMSRVEIIGRFYRAGFEVVDEQFREGEFFVTVRKVAEPVDDEAPSGSPIIHLRRKGKDGKEIVVHKFRTMYIYSEYIQTYVFQYQNLQSGGKFKDDYRVSTLGRLLRRTWLDELPMVWNMLRGDLKLVGVRPLSRQYFGLYTPEMQALRTRTKPGLLPPFYYERETPVTIDEIQASERRYLEVYLEHPFRTDWRYFWGIIGNIILNKKHSA